MSASTRSLQEAFTALAERTKSTSSFAVTGKATDLPNPFLRISGMQDPLALPTPPSQAHSVLSLPVTESVLDSELMYGHEHHIRPSKISFGHPRWQSSFEKLVELVRDRLELSAKLYTSFHGMLIHSPGGSIPSLRERLIASAPFGALVLTLPSMHKGSFLRVSHGMSNVVMDSGGESGAHDIRYAAFYVDCEHELKEVTSGYRIVLVYGLHVGGVHAGRNNPTLPFSPTESFRSFAADWTRRSLQHPADTLTKLCYILNRQQEHNATSWNALQGPDADLAHALREAACFDVHLVLLQCSKKDKSKPRPLDPERCFSVAHSIPMPQLSIPSSFRITVKGKEFVQGPNYFIKNCTFGDPNRPQSSKRKKGVHLRIAIVLWPREMLLNVAPLSHLGKALSDLIQEGKGKSLLGSYNTEVLLRRCLKRFKSGLVPGDAMLSVLLEEDVSVSITKEVLQRMDLTPFHESCALSEFDGLIDRHGISSLKGSLNVMLRAQGSSKFEPAVSAAWHILERLHKHACTRGAEERYLVQQMAEGLIPTLRQTVRNAGAHLCQYALRSTWRTVGPTGTIISVYSCLRSFDRNDLLAKAMSNIVHNYARFLPRRHLTDAVPELIKLNDGILSSEIKTLTSAIRANMLNDFRGKVTAEDLIHVCTALLPCGTCHDAVRDALARPSTFSPLACVFPTIIWLWQKSADACRAKVDFYAGILIRCLRDATSDEQESSKRCIIANGLITLSQMEKYSSPDVQSETSYQFQFAQAVIVRGELFNASTTVAFAILEALDLNPAISTEAADLLLSHSISSLKRETATPIPEAKDWSVKVPPSLSCDCETCGKAVKFLQDPCATLVELCGKDATHQGHTTHLLYNASLEEGSEFSVEVLTSKATRVNGRLLVTKSTEGRTAPKDLPILKAGAKRRSEDLSLLKKLEARRRVIGPVVHLDGAPNPKRARVAVVIEV